MSSGHTKRNSRAGNNRHAHHGPPRQRSAELQSSQRPAQATKTAEPAGPEGSVVLTPDEPAPGIAEGPLPVDHAEEPGGTAVEAQTTPSGPQRPEAELATTQRRVERRPPPAAYFPVQRAGSGSPPIARPVVSRSPGETTGAGTVYANGNGHQIAVNDRNGGAPSEQGNPHAPGRAERLREPDQASVIQASEPREHEPLHPEVRGDVGPLIDSLRTIFQRDRETASQGGSTRCGVCYLHYPLAELEYYDADGYYVCQRCARALHGMSIPMVRQQQR